MNIIFGTTFKKEDDDNKLNLRLVIPNLIKRGVADRGGGWSRQVGDELINQK